MASEPVRSTSIVTAPKDYTIPGAQQIRPLSIRASFDGSGAAGAWLPAVQILDNNGNVLSTHADPNVSVAAGGSADVTWFPGVKPQSAASATGAGTPTTATFYRSASLGAGDPALNVGAGATVTIPWLHHALPSDGSIVQSLAGNTIIQFNAPFICTHELHVGWDDGAYQKAAYIGTQSRLVVADDAGYPNVGAEAMGAASIDGLSWCYVHRDDGKIATDELHAYVYNGDAVAHDIWECWLSIHAWPATGYTGGVPRWPL